MPRTQNSAAVCHVLQVSSRALSQSSAGKCNVPYPNILHANVPFNGTGFVPTVQQDLFRRAFLALHFWHMSDIHKSAGQLQSSGSVLVMAFKWSPLPWASPEVVYAWFHPVLWVTPPCCV